MKLAVACLAVVLSVAPAAQAAAKEVVAATVCGRHRLP